MPRLLPLIVCLSSLAAPAWALDCTEPVTQADMSQCARIMFEAADGDLNHAYGMAIDAAKQMDQNLGAGEVTNAAMLRDAQRAWLPFRDKACAAESNLVRGGSMQPMMALSCLERLTRQRTEDLRYFSETN